MNRDEVIQWIIVNDEGGVVDAPGDPGGLTNKGISQRFLDSIRKDHPELPASPVDLTDAQIASLYQLYFWNPIHGDDLPPSLALVMMDMAVNEGPPTATMTLQHALGLKPDAHLGPITLAAVAKAEPRALLAEFVARRAVEYATLEETKPQFELGWMRRLVRVYTAAIV